MPSLKQHACEQYALVVPRLIKKEQLHINFYSSYPENPSTCVLRYDSCFMTRKLLEIINGAYLTKPSALHTRDKISDSVISVERPLLLLIFLLPCCISQVLISGPWECV